MSRSFLVSLCVLTVSKSLLMSRARSKKTEPARGWTSADRCTNSVSTITSPRDGRPIPVLGEAAFAPYHLAVSVRHKSGGRRVKSWPDHTLQSFGLVTTILNRMQPHTQHTLGSSEMHRDKTKTIHTQLEMHHSHNHITRGSNTKHNSPSPTRH